MPGRSDPPPREVRHRDVAAFDERATAYDAGWRGRMHHQISDLVARAAISVAPDAVRVLDVGCGTGYLLGVLADGLPDAKHLLGVDAAPSMVDVANRSRSDPRTAFLVGTAEHLPVQTGDVDLVVSSTSFDHWNDQARGLAECTRVLRPGGRLVLCDLFSSLLSPTLLGSRRTKARTPRRIAALIAATGLTDLRWWDPYAVLVKTLTAQRPEAESPTGQAFPSVIAS